MNLTWEQRLEELKRYKETFGTCNVKRGENREYAPLMEWIKYQRYRKAAGVLLPEQIARLNEIGFFWKTRGYSSRPDRRTSDEELLNDLKRLNKKLMQIPGRKEITQHGKYSASSYNRRFGGIINAREKAMIFYGKNILSVKKFTDRELLDDLKRLQRELNIVPGIMEVDKFGKYSANVYYDRFGGFKNARLKAGLAWEKLTFVRPPNISESALLDDLKRLNNELKRVPGNKEIKEYGKYSIITYFKRFGGIAAARLKAGLTKTKEWSVNKIPDSALLNELKRLHKKLKRIPREDDVNAYGKYSSGAYQYRFGGIVNARKKAGFKEVITKKISDQALLDDLKRLHKELKRMPAAKEINAYGKYDKKLYNRFGSFSNAREKAGIVNAEIFNKNHISDRELIDDLKRLCKILKRRPRRNDITEYGEYSPYTYIKRFGGLKNALEKAGLIKLIGEKFNSQKVADAELLDDLRRLHIELNKIPMVKDVVKYGKYGASSYNRRFGSFITARQLAGIA